MRARHLLLTAVLASVVLVAASACATGRVPPAASIQIGAVDCTSPAARAGFDPQPPPPPTGSPATRPAPIAGRIPDGFVPVAVVECTMDFTTAGVLERHLSGDLTALVEALRQPPATKPVGGACAAYGEVQPGLFLVDAAGRYVHVAWPLDECDHMQKPALAALGALHVDSERVVS